MFASHSQPHDPDRPARRRLDLLSLPAQPDSSASAAPTASCTTPPIKRVPLKLGLDLQGGMHLGARARPVAAGLRRPGEDLDIALTVLRKRIDEFGVQRAADPEGRRRPDRRRAARASRTRSAPRPIVQRNALPRVPPHRQDRRAREGASRRWTGRSAQLGVKSDRPGAAAAPRASRRCSAGTPARRRRFDRRRRGGLDRRGTRPGTSSSDLIQPAAAAGIQAMPGEYAVPEAAYPRVDCCSNSRRSSGCCRAARALWVGGPDRASASQQYRCSTPWTDKPIVDRRATSRTPPPRSTS